MTFETKVHICHCCVLSLLLFPLSTVMGLSSKVAKLNGQDKIYPCDTWIKSPEPGPGPGSEPGLSLTNQLLNSLTLFSPYITHIYKGYIYIYLQLLFPFYFTSLYFYSTFTLCYSRVTPTWISYSLCEFYSLFKLSHPLPVTTGHLLSLVL